MDKGAGGRGARAGACGAGEGARAADNAGPGARSLTWCYPARVLFFWRRSAPRRPRLGMVVANPLQHRAASAPLADPTARPPLRCLRRDPRRPRPAPQAPPPGATAGRTAEGRRSRFSPVEAPRCPTSTCARGRGAVQRESPAPPSDAVTRGRRPHQGAPRSPCATARLAPPGTLFSFRFICAPFNFLSPSEKGKANKRASLFLFRACKVEDI